MIRIIINADDFGLSPIVNKEIENALKKDWISSTSIMANTKFMDEVVRVVNDFPNKSFGVHLNITEGESLTKNPVLKGAGMIDGDGCFVKARTFQSRIYDEKVQHAIETEWDAQVYEVLSKGIKVSHVDGHHHCHTWYGFAEPLTAVMKKYDIHRVRNSFNSPFAAAKERLVDSLSGFLYNCGMVDVTKEEKANKIRPSVRSCVDKRVFWCCIKDMTKTDYFDAYKTVNVHVQGHQISSVTPDGVTMELMCHPGHPSYVDEFELVREDALGLYNALNVKVISYNEL